MKHTYTRFRQSTREARLCSFSAGAGPDKSPQERQEQVKQSLDRGIPAVRENLLKLKNEVDLNEKEKARQTLRVIGTIYAGLDSQEQAEIDREFGPEKVAAIRQVLTKLQNDTDGKAFNELKGILSAFQTPSTLEKIFDGNFSVEGVDGLIKTHLLDPVMKSEVAQKTLEKANMRPEKAAKLLFTMLRKGVAWILATTSIFGGTGLDAVAKEMHQSMALDAFSRGPNKGKQVPPAVMNRWSELYDNWVAIAHSGKSPGACPTIAAAVKDLTAKENKAQEEKKNQQTAKPSENASRIIGELSFPSSGKIEMHKNDVRTIVHENKKIEFTVEDGAGISWIRVNGTEKELRLTIDDSPVKGIDMIAPSGGNPSSGEVEILCIKTREAADRLVLGVKLADLAKAITESVANKKTVNIQKGPIPKIELK